LLHLAIVALEDRFQAVGVGRLSADAQHGQVQPAAAGGQLGILDPGEEFFRDACALSAPSRRHRGLGELVVGIARQQFIFVFKKLLKERQAVGPILGSSSDCTK